MKKMRKALASLAIAGMVLSMAPASVFAADADRIEGKDRYATSVQIAEKAFASATTAIVAAGNPDNLVDSLAAAPLAAQEKAPIYLTNIQDKKDIEDELLASLKKLGVTNVIAVGAAANDAATVAALEKAGVTVEKVAGKDRIETANNINAKLKDVKGTIVIGLKGEADAMSVASFAAANGYQIVIADGKGETTAKDVKYIIGGPTLVKDIAGAERIYGADRYATNEEVVKKLSFEFNTVYVANGASLADALAASVLAAKTKSPILLSNGSTVQAASYVNSKLTKDSKVVALGGTGAVSAAALNSVKYTAPVVKDLAVESVSAINLTQIQVKFTKAVNSESAKNPLNYTLYLGSAPDSAVSLHGNTKISLVDDSTVLITLDGDSGGGNQKLDNQLDNALMVNGVQSSDRSEKIVDSKHTFKALDMTAPEVKSVSVEGLRQIKVVFTEDVVATQAKNPSNYKLNGKSLSAYAVGPISYNPVTYTAVLPLGVDMEIGNNTLTVSYDNGILDYAGFKLVKSESTLSVVDDQSVPQVKAVEYVKDPIELPTGKYVRVQFTKPIAYDGLVKNGARSSLQTNWSNITIDGENTDARVHNGDIYLQINGDDGTKISKAGTHVVRISQSGLTDSTTSNDVYVVDGYGVKVPDNTTATYTRIVDTAAPTVEKVEVKDATTINVIFNEDLDSAYAEIKSNYVLKDAKGNVVSIATVRLNPESLGYNYVRLTVSDNLEAGTYSLTITGVRDESGNKMSEVVKSFSVADVVAPTLSSATVSGDNKTVYVTFSEPINSADLLNKANYNINGKALPSQATISSLQDGQVAKIVLPSNHTLGTISGGTVAVANMTDLAGNKMKGLYNQVPVTTVSNIGVVAFTGGDLIRVIDARTIEFQLDKQLAELDIANFSLKIGSDTPISPLATSTYKNDAEKNRATVTLKFNKDLVSAEDKTNLAALELYIDASAGKTKALDNAGLNTAFVGSAGTNAATGKFTTGNNDIIDKVAPKLESAVAAVSSGKLVVTVTMSENITGDASDFVVINNGKTYPVDTTKVQGGSISNTDTFTLTIVNVADTDTKIDFSQAIYVATKSVVTAADGKSNKVVVDQTGIKVKGLKTAMTDTKASAILTDTSAFDNVVVSDDGTDTTIALKAAGVTTATGYLDTNENLGVMVQVSPATGSSTPASTILTSIAKSDSGVKTLQTLTNTVLATGDTVKIKFVDLAGGYDSGWFTVFKK